MGRSAARAGAAVRQQAPLGAMDPASVDWNRGAGSEPVSRNRPWEGVPMNMRGKVVVVTGSNCGIGLETAVGVARLEATTVLACRNQSKAEAAAAKVTRRTWNDDVHVVSLELADLASVRKAAEEILSRWNRLDVLVNNAGGTWTERHQTAQGLEYTFGVNYLGPFYLTSLLLDRLRASAPSRIVNVTSVGHHAARRGMRFEDLQSEHGYDGMEAYCRSKLGNVLFTRELATRLKATGVTANVAHPGWVRSGFGMDGDTTGIMARGLRLIRPLQISPRRGARTSVYLATSPEIATTTGMYWVRSKPGHMSRHARDDEAAARLWDASEKLLASTGFSVV
jgi:NAD(P)-dependent dehydrogenase (short-subunit alcohol dehydrogenase family)